MCPIISQNFNNNELVDIPYIDNYDDDMPGLVSVEDDIPPLISADDDMPQLYFSEGEGNLFSDSQYEELFSMFRNYFPGYHREELPEEDNDGYDNISEFIDYYRMNNY